MNETGSTALALAPEVETLGAEIRNLTATHKYMTLWYATQIGKRLTEAKEMLEHGQWMDFLKEKTEFSSSSASRLMTLYREYGTDGGANFPTLGNLSVTKALSLLALPENEREEFAAEVNAEDISSRELEQAIKERDAALAAKKQAEDDAEGTALRLGEVETERDKAIEQMEDAEEEAKELRAKVKELESRPVDVAVEVDEEAVKRAAEEADKAARAEMQKTVDDAAAKAKKLKEALDEAKAALKIAQDAGSTEKDTLTAKVEELEKKLAMSAPEIAQFSVWFNQWQKAYAEMTGLLSAAPEDAGARLKNAVKAVLAKWTEEATP